MTDSSDLAKYHLEKGHSLDYQNPRILAFEIDFGRWKVFEMLDIKEYTHSINNRSDV